MPALTIELTRSLKDIIAQLTAFQEILADPRDDLHHGVTYTPGASQPLQLDNDTFALAFRNQDISNHTRLRIELQQGFLHNSLAELVGILSMDAPYFAARDHKFTIEVSRGQQIRVCINGVGDHVSAMPAEEAARNLGFMRQWVGDLSSGGRLFDVKGHLIRANAPSEALLVYCAMMQPESPASFLGNSPVTVLERHSDMLVDKAFFESHKPQ